VVIDIGANATKADDALAWLALNDTRIDDVVIDIGANSSRIDALEIYDSKLTVIAGGPAGNHTLTGVVVGDELSGVIYVAKGAENLTAVATEPFTILDTDVIENSAHTNTTGGYLIVGWIDKTYNPS